MKSDEEYIEKALLQARKALEMKEVPIGAVVVYKEEIIGSGFNLKEKTQDPTAHAEIIAIRDAARKMGSWRLEDCELYVTLEPCPMCAGAMIQARIRRLIYGAEDPKAGAVDTLYNLVQDQRFNHSLEVNGGVLKEECSALLTNFFNDLRKEKC